VAIAIVEKLRSRIPYIRRLHERIDHLHHRLAAIETAPKLIEPDGSRSSKVGEQFREFLRLLQPHDAAHVRKLRFDGDGDGGYIMLDDLGQCRNALSLGVGLDVSWDLSLANRGLRIFQFDHMLDGSPQGHPRFVFNKASIVARAESPGEITLAQIVEGPDLADDKILIAKIDIEGCEWDILAHSSKTTLTQMRQIAIEFHDLREFIKPDWRAKALTALANLMTTHACVHIHGNNCEPFIVIGGIAFPNVFEATFARRSDYVLASSTAVFPTELDRPNNPKAADLYLGRWSY